MGRLLLCLLLTLSAVSCSAALSLIEAARLVVGEYCGLPERARLANRALVARAIRPHRIEIRCAGDEDDAA